MLGRGGSSISTRTYNNQTGGDASSGITQSIRISRNQATDPILYNITTRKGALVLRFRLLYLRDPGPQEGDFVIGVPDLQLYVNAEMVWSEFRD